MNRLRYGYFFLGYAVAMAVTMGTDYFTGGMRPDSHGVKLARDFELVPPKNGRYESVEQAVLQPVIVSKLTSVADELMKTSATYHETCEAAFTSKEGDSLRLLARANLLDREASGLRDQFRRMARRARWHGFVVHDDPAEYASLKDYLHHAGL